VPQPTTLLRSYQLVRFTLIYPDRFGAARISEGLSSIIG
jgi:hypothetical protein